MRSSVGVRVQRLEHVETGHSHLTNLVIEHPTNVLEVGVRKELNTGEQGFDWRRGKVKKERWGGSERERVYMHVHVLINSMHAHTLYILLCVPLHTST